MHTANHLWALVLAAGEGKRVQSLSRDSQGLAVPKQFCSWGTGRSMLRWAVDRAMAWVPPERTVVVTAFEHRRWWKPELQEFPEENIIVQPKNRGTAIGILLPLLHILQRDPRATVLVFPSDHFVEEEEVLEEAMGKALQEMRWITDSFILFGMSPNSADSEYGWIIPSENSEGPLQSVNLFVEKPNQDLASALLKKGGLWNSFMFAAKGNSLLRLYLRNFSELVILLLKEFKNLPLLYEDFPTLDFSRDILEHNISDLRVFPVPYCGWSDLGTPERLNAYLYRSQENRYVSSAEIQI
ncbi:MAG: NTP transferase domain-containing protein [Deltaproteobacteria bacterium]|nr:NTP transferase domain-containing protein [Deltaproteobacteria bacterium]